MSFKKSIPFIAAAALACTAASAGERGDWMIDPAPYKAEAVKSPDGKTLIIGNGLVERALRLDATGTTIALNNLVTGDQLLRSVRPEAEVVIDNMNIPVGGMTGQPIHNYLLHGWLEQMKPDPMAMIFTGYEVKPISKRFDWAPRTEWMAANPEWPPEGIEVVMSFGFDDGLIDRMSRRNSSDEFREVYISDDFLKLSDAWSINVSESNPLNAFMNEGKPGEMLVPANSAVFAEFALPAPTEIITARINPGTDKSATWGPGVAWVFDTKTVKVNLRTTEGNFAVTGAGLEYELNVPGVREGEPVDIKMQRMGNVVACSYSYDDQPWKLLYEIKIPDGAVSQFVRVGKMDGGARASETKEPGEKGRSRIEHVSVVGPVKDSKAAEQSFAYLKDVKVKVHYEIYDGIPLISKWISLDNNSLKPVTLNQYKSEILAVTETENSTPYNEKLTTPNITVESDFVHNSKSIPNNNFSEIATERHVHWEKDPLYKTQIDWNLRNPCLLIAKPQYGPAQEVGSGETFASHRIWELIHDTWEYERRTLQIRRMFRTIAPWVAENPAFMHVRSADNESVRKAVDQCADVGFEMIIMTFGSGVEIENASPENLSRMKELADYAHSKGIALGGYSLLASRSAGPDNDVIPDKGSAITFGSSPCLESNWGRQYFDNLYTYYKTTGQDILEHDGSYPGDECAATTHPGHKDLQDSQWNQYRKIQDFYHWCKANGIFLNVPDWYFVNGANKTGMGYRENNWSLPREQQEVIERQNIYDGTWMKTPSMGWMMVPLVEYHGGGAAATIEPLREHLDHYDMRLANNFGAGVIACYRGPQLYDAPETRAIVKKWADFYKKHRAILNADVIHLRRPDGRDWDGLMHADPSLAEKGLLMLYNPLQEEIVKTIEVPLYYTGLTSTAKVSREGAKAEKYELDRDYKIRLNVKIPAGGYTWYVIE